MPLTTAAQTFESNISFLRHIYLKMSKSSLSDDSDWGIRIFGLLMTKIWYIWGGCINIPTVKHTSVFVQ